MLRSVLYGTLSFLSNSALTRIGWKVKFKLLNHKREQVIPTVEEQIACSCPQVIKKCFAGSACGTERLIRRMDAGKDRVEEQRQDIKVVKKRARCCFPWPSLCSIA